MKILIVEDEDLAVKKLKKTLFSVDESATVVGEADSIKSTVNWLQSNPSPDLILMDIELADGQSFEIFNHVEVKSPVIFITSYDEYALKAFKVNSVDYLLKPFSRDRFNKAIEKFLASAPVPDAPANKETEKLLEYTAQSPAQHERIVVKTGTKVKIIPVADVQYLQADDDYVSVFTQEGSYLKNKTMSFFEQTLDPRQFVRVHRSYMVSVPEITRIDPYEKDSHLVLLTTGAKLPASKTGYLKLKSVLGI